MFLLYTDETNLDPKDGDFFVYGGLAIPAAVALQLSQAVEAIRTKAGISPEFLLKFNNRPSHLDHQGFIDVKRR